MSYLITMMNKVMMTVRTKKMEQAMMSLMKMRMREKMA